MKRNKKALLYFLVANAIISSNAKAEEKISSKHDRLYDSMAKNIETGKSNGENYKLIERLFNKRKKDLKDLSKQNDYIVKPDNLEWQIFFSGFYSEKKRGDNTKENAEFHSDPNYGPKNGVPGKPYAQEPEVKEMKPSGEEPRVSVQLREMEKDPTNLNRNISEVQMAEVQPIAMNVTTPGVKALPKINVAEFGEITIPVINPVSVAPISVDTTITVSPPGGTTTPLLQSFKVTAVPAAPTVVEPVVGEITAPQVVPIASTIPTIDAVPFNPVMPSPVAPTTFSPVSLSFIPTGFSQGAGYSFSPSSTSGIFNNYDSLVGNNTVISLTPSTGNFTGSVTYTGATTLTTPATVSITPTMNAFYNLVESRNVNISGDFTLVNKNTAQQTIRFISYNPYFVGMTTAGYGDGIAGDKTLVLSANLTVDGTNAGSCASCATVAVEHQLLAPGGYTATSIFRNDGTITLRGGEQAIGIVIDSEGLQFTTRARTINNGSIIINNTRSIGIDFGAYYSNVLNVGVDTGNITINGSQNYGLRIPNLTTLLDTYYQNTLINGSILQPGNGIEVKGTQNVGVSISKKISAGTDLIGNITNLNVLVNGVNGIGILRRADFDATQNQDMILNSAVVQSLDFGANANGSVLIRSDRFKTILDRDITINTGIGNNVVMQSNGTGTSVVLAGTRAITLGTGAGTSVALLSSNAGSLINNGSLFINGGNSQGIAVMTTSSGTNSGAITVAGDNSVGVYNAGTFNMTSGSVDSAAKNGVGIYSTSGSTTNVTGGTVTAGNGSAALSANNSSINIAGSGFTVNSDGLFFYKIGTGNLVVNPAGATATINQGGKAFYLSGGGLPSLSTMTSGGALTMNMGPGSVMVGWDSPGSLALSALTTSSMPTNVTIVDNGTVSNPYKKFFVNRANLTIDQDVTLLGSGSQYDRSEFVQSSVTLNAGKTITGTDVNQIGIAQRSYDTAGLNTIALTNNGTISLSGNSSTGIVGDYATINNTASGIINISGNNSTGIFSANGSAVTNSGVININATGTGNSAVGIYGANELDASSASYGDKKINIVNAGSIKYNGTSDAAGMGIYVKNNNINKNDAIVTLNAGSNIDMTGSGNGVGIFADNGIVNINNGTIKATEGTTGIYATNGTEINSANGSIDLYSKGVGVYLAGLSQYNSGAGKFMIYEDGGTVFGLEAGSVFNISSSNIDNMTYGGGNSLSFILGGVGKTAYTYNTGLNLAGIDKVTLFGTNGGAVILGTDSNLETTGINIVAVGAIGIKDSGVTAEREITNSGKINVTSGSNGIYVKDGATALNNASGTNNIIVSNTSTGMFAKGTGTLAENTGDILVGKESVGLYSSASGTNKGVILSGGNITSYGTVAGTPDEKATAIFIDSESDGSQTAGIISLTGKESTGIYNKGRFTLSNGTVDIQSENGAGIYSTYGSTTNITGGTIKAGNGSVALYADESAINISGGAFTIGNAGLLFYNYPSTGTGTGAGHLNMTGSANVTVNSGGTAFYIEGEDASSIGAKLNSLVTSSNPGVNRLNIALNSGSDLIRWNNPSEGTLNLSNLRTVSSSIANVNVTGLGAGNNNFSINRGDLLIDENVAFAAGTTGNLYNGVEMSQSKVTLGTGKTISGTGQEQIGIAQANYTSGTIDDVVITNNGTISLNGKKSTGMALDYGVINNTGIINISSNGTAGEGSLGIFSANGTNTTNSGTINVSGIDTVGIYGVNDFVPLTSAPYGDRTINITHGGTINLTDANKNYGIYLENTAVPQSDSNLTLASGSKIIMSDNGVTDRSIGISLKNSTLTNNGGTVEVGVNGVGLYAENSKVTGTGGVTKLHGKSVGYNLTGNVDFNAAIGSVEFNGSNDAAAVFAIGDNTSGNTLSFNPGDIAVTSTNGGKLTVGSIGKGRDLTLNNKIEVKAPTSGVISGAILSLTEGKVTLDTGANLISENDMIGVNATGAYSIPGYEVTNKGKISIKGNSAGIYVTNGAEALNDTTGQISIGEKSVGMYGDPAGNNSTLANNGEISLNGLSAVGMFGKITGAGTLTVNNAGVIKSNNNYTGTLGMVLENPSITATNSGTIDLRGDDSIGVYNKDGKFEMTNGSIYVDGDKSVGIYSNVNTALYPTSQTKVTLGTVEAQGTGSIALYAEKSAGSDTTIGLGNNVNIKASNGALAFYTSIDAVNNPTGHFNIANAGDTVNAEIGSNGTAFYYKGLNTSTDIQTFLGNMITGSGTLNLILTDTNSRLLVLEPVGGGVMNLSSMGTGSGFLPSRIVIDPSSVSNHKILQVNKGNLNIDSNVNLDSPDDTYNRTDFSSSTVTLASGKTITGAMDEQKAIAQKNYNGGARSAITLTNDGGMINLSGDKSVAIVADYGEINNKSGSTVIISGTEGIGLLGTNGSLVKNNGVIKIGEDGVGIYGANLLDPLSPLPAYGDQKIEIENNGNIEGLAITDGEAYGIIADNTKVAMADSKVTLGSTSNIDMSLSDNSVGVYANNSTLGVNGTVVTGKNGVGIFAKETNTTINNGFNLNLAGNNSVGIYTEGTQGVNVLGTVNALVTGTDSALFNFDSTGTVAGLGQNLLINPASTGTFSLGSIMNNQFDFSNASTNTVTLGNGNAATGINAKNSAVRYGSNVNINGGSASQTGMALDGTSSAGFIPGYTNYEGINEGSINLTGDKTAGIYSQNGARVVNAGDIKVGTNSAGIYAKNGGKIANTGAVEIGANSQGLVLNGGTDVDSNIIRSTASNVIGIYTQDITGRVTSSGSVDLSGDKSIGIYSKGSVTGINNSGSILIGDSSDENSPSVGIYYDDLAGTTIDSKNMTTGDKSIGIYNKAATGTINQINTMSVGKGGTGIYTNGGNVNVSGTLSIDQAFVDSVSGNVLNGVGVYGNGVVNVSDNTAMTTIGDDSYGYVLNQAGSSFNSSTGTVSLDNLGTYVYSKGTTVVNNKNVTMLGRENVAFYTEDGSVTNYGDIDGTAGIGNIGIYNENGSVLNNRTIQVGDSQIIDPASSDKNFYAVGVYGVDSNVTNASGAVIKIGADGIGIYGVKSDKAVSRPTIINMGLITSDKSGAQGMYIVNANGINRGTIHLAGDNSTGIVAEGATITNDTGAKIILDGDDSTGIYLSEGSVLDNKGTIELNGTNSTGVVRASDWTAGNGYAKPSIVNAGLIRVNDNFSINNFDMIIEPNLSTNKQEAYVNSLGETYMFVVDETYLDVKGNLSVSPTESIIIKPTFTKGTSAEVYKLENAIVVGGQIQFLGSSTNIKSGSLTWDVTPIGTSTGYDIYAKKIAYDNFTSGLWYEDFGRALDEKYLTPVEEKERKEMFEKIDMIEKESDFRHVMASLAGNVYANMNQKEEDTARVLENSLNLLENSKNNTKENVKINIIAGKGKNSEDTDGVVGYDYNTAGVLALREIERTYRHTLGYSLGYLHTGFDYNDGNSSEESVDTIQLGAHSKYNLNDWKLKNDLTGMVSLHDVNRNIDWPAQAGRSEMTGTYETYSITSDNSLGKEFALGENTSVTPYGALRAMYVVRPTFDESGKEALEVEGNDAWSVKPRAGVELKTALPLGPKKQWKLKGTLDLAYEYELADLNEREKARLTAVEDDYHNLSKPQDEKGTFRTKAAVGVEVEDKYGIFINGEYSIGNKDEDDYRAGVTLKVIF